MKINTNKLANQYSKNNATPSFSSREEGGCLGDLWPLIPITIGSLAGAAVGHSIVANEIVYDNFQPQPPYSSEPIATRLSYTNGDDSVNLRTGGIYSEGGRTQKVPVTLDDSGNPDLQAACEIGSTHIVGSSDPNNIRVRGENLRIHTSDNVVFIEEEQGNGKAREGYCIDRLNIFVTPHPNIVTHIRGGRVAVVQDRVTYPVDPDGYANACRLNNENPDYNNEDCRRQPMSSKDVTFDFFTMSPDATDSYRLHQGY